MTATSAIVRRARPRLGTLVEIRVSAAPAAASAALEGAFAAIERVHRAMSAQEPASDIALLRAGHGHGADPWTRRVLEHADDMYAATDGLFDCRACGYALDGIAKGFAVDRAVECLQGAGIESGAVNAGGDLRVFGTGFQPIYVRPPHRPTELRHIGSARDAAVATSGRELLVDPRGRQACPAPRGVTVIAADCVTADALTKPCLLEPERAEHWAAKFGGRILLWGVTPCR
jgi:thiamine biosynthesis lipoprotein